MPLSPPACTPKRAQGRLGLTRALCSCHYEPTGLGSVRSPRPWRQLVDIWTLGSPELGPAPAPLKTLLGDCPTRPMASFWEGL